MVNRLSAASWGENDVSLNRHSVSLPLDFGGVNFLAWVVNNDYLRGGRGDCVQDSLMLGNSKMNVKC